MRSVVCISTVFTRISPPLPQNRPHRSSYKGRFWTPSKCSPNNRPCPLTALSSMNTHTSPAIHALEQPHQVSASATNRAAPYSTAQRTGQKEKNSRPRRPRTRTPRSTSVILHTNVHTINMPTRGRYRNFMSETGLGKDIAVKPGETGCPIWEDELIATSVHRRYAQTTLHEDDGACIRNTSTSYKMHTTPAYRCAIALMDGLLVACLPERHAYIIIHGVQKQTNAAELTAWTNHHGPGASRQSDCASSRARA